MTSQKSSSLPCWPVCVRSTPWHLSLTPHHTHTHTCWSAASLDCNGIPYNSVLTGGLGGEWLRDRWVNEEEEMSCELCGKVGQNWLLEKWWSVSFTSACLCEKLHAPLPCWIDWICMSLREGMFVWWRQHFWWQRCTKIQILLISVWPLKGLLSVLNTQQQLLPLFLFNLCFRKGTRGHCKLPLHLSPFNYANGIHYHRLKCCSLIWRWIRVSVPAEVFKCGHLLLFHYWKIYATGWR